MKIISKSRYMQILSFVFGIIVFVIFLKIFQPIDSYKLVVLFLISFTIIFISNRIASYYLKNHITTSLNPRQEFWDLFLKNKLEESDLMNIPSTTDFLKEYEQSYCFYDKGEKKKIRLLINGERIKFQNIYGRFSTYDYSSMSDMKLFAEIRTQSDTQNMVILNIKIDLKNGETDYCDIKKINCNIDSLEQIINHFKMKITK